MSENFEPEILIEESEVEVVEAVPMEFGKVVECPKLNVRSGADAKAPVVCIIDRNTTVEIDMTESTEYFYKVYLENGSEGYCMKQFIELI